MIINIYNIDLILEIDNNKKILYNLLNFWIIEKYMNFNLDLEIIMNKIDILENQEIWYDILDLRNVSKWIIFRIDLIIIMNEINNNIIKKI